MRYKWVVIWMVLCLCVIGGGVVELGEHSSGQLVCARALGQGTPVVMIYRKPGSEAGKWMCQGLLDNKLREVPASAFRVLPMTEQIQPWELTTYCIYQLRRKGTPAEEAAMVALMEWRGGMRGMLVRRYLAEEKQFMTSIAPHIKPCYSQKKSTRDLAIGEIREKLEAAPMIDTLGKLQDEGDYYAASILLLRFKYIALAPLPAFLLKQELLEAFGKLEGELLRGYVSNSDKVTARYQAFSELFPKNGRAVFVEPVSNRDLVKKCTSSYEGYIITRSKSSVCDFEAWGAGMLSVLQMLTGGSEAAMKFGEEFDVALKQYKDSLKQTGK